MIDQVLGWTATILFSLMLIPQIIKTIKLKDTTGVSVSLFIIYLISNIIALYYSILIEQIPLTIKYSIALIISVMYLFIYYRVKRLEVIRYHDIP